MIATYGREIGNIRVGRELRCCMRVVFVSKVDAGIAVAGLTAPLLALFMLSAARRHAAAALWIPGLVTAVIALIVLWIVLSTYYEFEHDALTAHTGPFRWRIPLGDISGVRASQSTHSGPALSLDRLEISWGRGRSLLISPRDKAGFLAMLHRRAPHLAP